MEKAHVIINWQLSARGVMKALGIRQRLGRYSDWQVLARYPFGELAYDYEEGLKFAVPLNKLKAAITFIRNFHKTNRVPFVDKGGFVTVQCQLDIIGKKLPTHAQTFKAAGLVQDPEFDFVWNLLK